MTLKQYWVLLLSQRIRDEPVLRNHQRASRRRGDTLARNVRVPNFTSSSALRAIALGALASLLIFSGCLNPRPDEMPSADNAPGPSSLLPGDPSAASRAPGEPSAQAAPTSGANGNQGPSNEPARGEADLNATAAGAPPPPASRAGTPGDAGTPPADAGPDAN